MTVCSVGSWLYRNTLSVLEQSPVRITLEQISGARLYILVNEQTFICKYIFLVFLLFNIILIMVFG